jgi:hypothetical protein
MIIVRNFIREIHCIFQNLLSLLSGPSQDLGRPQLQAVRTLADYASCLRSKINCHQDPNLYTSKQGKKCYIQCILKSHNNFPTLRVEKYIVSESYYNIIILLLYTFLFDSEN